MKNSDYSFIIIGAAGFMGSAFSAYLKKNAYQVFDIYRGQISDDKSAFQFGEEISGLQNKQIIIVDFAYTSVPNSSFLDPVKDYSENLYNVIRHLEFARQLPNACYIYISSGGTVYGNPFKQEPITEDHSNIPLSPYGITKLCCEKYVLMYKEVYGLNVKIIRPSNIYGPGLKPFRGQGIVATAIAKVLKKETIQIFGDGLQVRDYLYIDDFCSILHDIIEVGKNEHIYNAGSQKGLTINDLLNKIKNHLGVPVSTDYFPSRPFDVKYNVLDSSRAIALKKWQPIVSIDEGLSKSIRWLRNLN